MTSMEISKKYCGNLPKWQHKKNVEYFDSVWEMLNDRGIYFYPNVQKSFRKLPNKQWEEV